MITTKRLPRKRLATILNNPRRVFPVNGPVRTTRDVFARNSTSVFERLRRYRYSKNERKIT